MLTKPEIDLTEIGTGSVTAPAGHGKTEVIAASVAAHPKLRFLVLTHTNAGVASLRDRIARYGATGYAHVETISALALRLVRAFPVGIGWIESKNKIDYAAAIAGAAAVVSRPTVLSAFASTYDHLVVDEYQDCTRSHHAFIGHIARCIPTVVLGDPLQAIFSIDRADPLVPWGEVIKAYPSQGELSTPHRWTATNPVLGSWLQSIRDPLRTGVHPIRTDTNVVTHVRLDRPASQGGLYRLLSPGTSTVIIVGNSAKNAVIPKIAQMHAKLGVSVHETAQQNEVVSLCDALAEPVNAATRLGATTDFLAGSASGVKATAGFDTVMRNVKKSGSVGRSATPFALAVRKFMDQPIPAVLNNVIQCVLDAPGCRIYRGEQLAIVRKSLITASDWTDLPGAARQFIDQAGHVRHLRARPLEVGSTLRVKGLEYDQVILLDPSEVPSAEHLYVALTRARHRIILATVPDQGLGKWFTG